jgi:hypothetical protein
MKLFSRETYLVLRHGLPVVLRFLLHIIWREDINNTHEIQLTRGQIIFVGGAEPSIIRIEGTITATNGRASRA